VTSASLEVSARARRLVTWLVARSAAARTLASTLSRPVAAIQQTLSLGDAGRWRYVSDAGTRRRGLSGRAWAAQWSARA